MTSYINQGLNKRKCFFESIFTENQSSESVQNQEPDTQHTDSTTSEAS